MQTTPDPLRSGRGMDLSAKKIKRIKRWSHVGTLLSLKRSYGEKVAQVKLPLETYTAWLTPGWPFADERTSLAPLYFPCLRWFWRWLHVGVICELEPAWYVSDESHIAYGFSLAHSLHCEMSFLYSLSTPPLSFWLFFKAEGYFWVSNSSPLNGTIVFVAWFLRQCNSSKELCVTAT